MSGAYAALEFEPLIGQVWISSREEARRASAFVASSPSRETSADALAAVFNPSVNSYKRIDATVTLSGATWSPNAISYSGNNRTHMVRIPDPGRFELRLMDGAVNPYLAQAAVLVAGLDGIANRRDPGKRLDINMYTEGQRLRRIRKLPLNLLDAVRLFDQSAVVRGERVREVTTPAHWYHHS